MSIFVLTTEHFSVVAGWTHIQLLDISRDGSERSKFSVKHLLNLVSTPKKVHSCKVLQGLHQNIFIVLTYCFSRVF